MINKMGKIGVLKYHKKCVNDDKKNHNSAQKGRRTKGTGGGGADKQNKLFF